MKRNILLTSLLAFYLSLAFSQIKHVDYGEGLVIALNENYAMDVNDDGVIDFYVNQYPDELGFTPIFAVGCFASPSEYAMTIFDSRQLQVFEEGERIGIDGANMYDYIDDDRGSISNTNGNIDESWTHMEDQIIGFAVFGENITENVFNGWMRVAVNTEENTLIIKEYAYTDWTAFEVGSIIAGDIGSTAIKTLDEVLDQVIVSPNPVKDQFQMSFNYTGEETLQISILDNTGKLISQQTANGNFNHTFNTSDWTAGMYFVNFRTSEGVSSEKIFVTK